MQEGYGSRQFIEHLAHRGHYERMFELIEDPRWYRLQLRQDLTGRLYLNNLETALYSLQKLMVEQPGNCRRLPRYFEYEYRYALASARINTLPHSSFEVLLLFGQHEAAISFLESISDPSVVVSMMARASIYLELPKRLIMRACDTVLKHANTPTPSGRATLLTLAELLTEIGNCEVGWQLVCQGIPKVAELPDPEQLLQYAVVAECAGEVALAESIAAAASLLLSAPDEYEFDSSEISYFQSQQRIKALSRSLRMVPLARALSSTQPIIDNANELVSRVIRTMETMEDSRLPVKELVLLSERLFFAGSPASARMLLNSVYKHVKGRLEKLDTETLCTLANVAASLKEGSITQQVSEVAISALKNGIMLRFLPQLMTEEEWIGLADSLVQLGIALAKDGNDVGLTRVLQIAEKIGDESQKKRVLAEVALQKALQGSREQTVAEKLLREETPLLWRDYDKAIAGFAIASAYAGDCADAETFLVDMHNKTDPQWYGAVLSAVANSFAKSGDRRGLLRVLRTGPRINQSLSLFTIGCTGSVMALLAILLLPPLLFANVVSLNATAKWILPVIFIIATVIGLSFYIVRAKLRSELVLGKHAGVPVHFLALRITIAHFGALSDLAGLHAAASLIGQLNPNYENREDLMELLAKSTARSAQQLDSLIAQWRLERIIKVLGSDRVSPEAGFIAKLQIAGAMIRVVGLTRVMNFFGGHTLQNGMELVSTLLNALETPRSLISLLLELNVSERIKAEVLILAADYLVDCHDAEGLEEILIAAESLEEPGIRTRVVGATTASLLKCGKHKEAERIIHSSRYNTDITFQTNLLERLLDGELNHTLLLVAVKIALSLISEERQWDYPPVWATQLTESLCRVQDEESITTLLFAEVGSQGNLALLRFAMAAGLNVHAVTSVRFLRLMFAEAIRIRTLGLPDFWQFVAMFLPLFSQLCSDKSIITEAYQKLFGLAEEHQRQLPILDRIAQIIQM